MGETTVNGNGKAIPQWFVSIAFSVMGVIGLGVSAWAAKGYTELREKSAAQDVRNEGVMSTINDIKSDVKDIKNILQGKR